MTKLVVSHYMPPDHGTHVDFILPWTERLRVACPSLDIEVHCEGSEFGLLEKQYEQVMSGAVDIAHSPVALPAGRFPLTNLMNLPFLVQDTQQACDRLWQAHAEHLANEFSPLHVLALHADSGGVLHMRDQPIATIDDLVGKRIRTPAGPVADAMAMIGAHPIHLLPPAIGPAARAGDIDGAIMAWDVLAYTQTQDIFRYHYLDTFYVSPLYLVMNPQSYASLSNEERRALDAVSGSDLTPRFGAFWKAWSEPGHMLAKAEGHSLEPLPATVLSGLQEAGAASAKLFIERLSGDELAAANSVVDIFSGRDRAN
ncbi:TRAP transporter substrate-binding protein DctP [Brucella intermedia]|uniref:TRAP transporter substrate-binding protein DctP n=1 Tax=Brucella intermedia TaxID=94625 RepID=UPI0022495F17|nr:TRAP transporter substrate-binding protein DctP [Brucella intermedia]